MNEKTKNKGKYIDKPEKMISERQCKMTTGWKIFQFFLVIFIYPVTLVLFSGYILSLDIIDIITKYLMLILVGFTLYLTKMILFKEFSVRDMMYSIFFLLIKSTIMVFSVVGLLTISLTGNNVLYETNIVDKTFIVHYDVLFIYFIAYILTAGISFFLSERIVIWLEGITSVDVRTKKKFGSGN